ncbi:uncharacterized protein LOC105686985 isoform X1 [Athalia rosae]|uniref:uncharacterized protein LOC105686985 isoform X1 n=1 Tax=Athalia rosae TaxID=37344 RepID=UPI00203324C8|nr:uncharacterized protein LOC105686985 isoform X1 [Athalia rosae]
MNNFFYSHVFLSRFDIPAGRLTTVHKMSGKLILLVTFLCAFSDILAKPTIYKKNEDNIFEPVMVPVSSTVIPLPVYRVEYGFGFVSKDKKAQSAFKPAGSIKLITAKKTQETKPE